MVHVQTCNSWHSFSHKLSFFGVCEKLQHKRSDGGRREHGGGGARCVKAGVRGGGGQGVLVDHAHAACCAWQAPRALLLCMLSYPVVGLEDMWAIRG